MNPFVPSPCFRLWLRGRESPRWPSEGETHGAEPEQPVQWPLPPLLPLECSVSSSACAGAINLKYAADAAQARFGEHPGPRLPAPVHCSHRHEKGFSVCFKARRQKEGKNKLVYAAAGTSNQRRRPADPRQPEHDSVLPHKEALGTTLFMASAQTLFTELIAWAASVQQHLGSILRRRPCGLNTACSECPALAPKRGRGEKMWVEGDLGPI